jgi:hypothetical protein
MFRAIKEFFTGKKPEAAPEAPYKIDTPAAPVIEVPAVEVPAVAPVVTVVVDPQITDAVTQAPAKKPRVKKSTGAKPAVKKPRKTK